MFMQDKNSLKLISNDYISINRKTTLYKDSKLNKLTKKEKAYYDYINSLLQQLNEDEKRIIFKDYFNINNNIVVDKYWYLNYYSKSTYLILKQQAIDKILHLLKM